FRVRHASRQLARASKPSVDAQLCTNERDYVFKLIDIPLTNACFGRSSPVAGNAQQMLTLEREAFMQGVEIGVRQAELAGLQHIRERIDFKRAGAFTTILDEQLEQLNRCANRRNIHELNSAAKRTGYRFFLEDAGDCLRVRRKLAYNQRDFVKRIT